MANEFKTIETQEELDAIIKARLDRNTKTVTDEVKKSYDGYLSPDEAKKLNDQITSLTVQLTERDGSIADLTAKNKAYETASVKARIAHEKGLPFELAERLSGETEQDIEADAEKLAQFITPADSRQSPAPLFAPQGAKGNADPVMADLAGMLNGLIPND
jgi:antitoxin component of RelBE/YafQ-DinJ toxin-antitoxin module